jgi:hypothetical protein
VFSEQSGPILERREREREREREKDRKQNKTKKELNSFFWGVSAKESSQ